MSIKSRKADAFLGERGGMKFYNSNIVEESDFKNLEDVTLIDMDKDEFDERNNCMSEYNHLYNE